MEELKDIRDDQIRIIGEEGNKNLVPRNVWIFILSIFRFSHNRSNIEIVDTLINDIPIKIFIPHNAELSLHINRLNKEDKSVIYAAQVADLRADNGGVVGAFVLNGEPRSWEVSKKGYCASLNGKVTIGVAENPPLFEKATEEGGYSFRQYPLAVND